MSEATAEASTCTDPDFAVTKASCGCLVPGYMLHTNGRAECVNCQPSMQAEKGGRWRGGSMWWVTRHSVLTCMGRARC